jgi:hypothetical protein
VFQLAGHGAGGHPSAAISAAPVARVAHKPAPIRASAPRKVAPVEPMQPMGATVSAAAAPALATASAGGDDSWETF